MTAIDSLQRELTSAIDFHYPAWWSDEQRQSHRDRIKRLECELDQALALEKAKAAAKELAAEPSSETDWAQVGESMGMTDEACDRFEQAYDDHIEDMARFDY